MSNLLGMKVIIVKQNALKKACNVCFCNLIVTLHTGCVSSYTIVKFHEESVIVLYIMANIKNMMKVA